MEQVNCIIIHGCPSDAEKAMNPKTRTYDKHWIPWIKKKLIARGIKTETPLMPSPWEPDYAKFKKEFEKYGVNEKTVLIGHSCGCAFLVRWLGETKQRISKLILVAPWKIPDMNDNFRKAFYNYPIDQTIKSRVKEIVMFTSDDEEKDGKKSLRIFHEVLDGRVIELRGRGHYTLGDMETEEFPELLEEVAGGKKSNEKYTLSNPVLKSIKLIVEQSKFVKIHPERITKFSKTFTNEHVTHWLNEAPFDFSDLNDDERLHFLLLFSSLSFSYWNDNDPQWIVEYKGKKSGRGSWSLISALRRAIDDGKPILNAQYLAEINEKALEEILRANIKMPLLDERVKVLREVGRVLIKKYDGKFGNVIKSAKGDALALLRIIVKDFPPFNDVSLLEGKKVFFYKKAQLLINDVYQAFNGKSYGDLKNINELTACADYKLPQIMRELGIISYSPELERKIDNRIHLLHDSREEVEIRANTIWVVELVKRELIKRIPDISSMHINDHFWLEAGKVPPSNPYHLTRTVYY